MRLTLTTISILSVAVQGVRAQDLKLSFAPDSERFAAAARQYQATWDAEGPRIIQAMEAVSGLRFGPSEIRVILYEGPSGSGAGNTPMKLNVRYPLGMTLLHELGHRLNSQIANRPKDIDEHKLLYLYLYDVWLRLYGKDFADNAVETEKKWASQGFYFIKSAWEWALSLNEQERASKLKEIIGSR
jgi:hypothetical protein